MNDLVTYQDLLDAGVSYRRLHHWSGRGLLKPDNPGVGTGRSLRWPASELDVARLMLLLVDECEMSPGKAAEIARSDGRVEIADEFHRVVVTWERIEQ